MKRTNYSNKNPKLQTNTALLDRAALANAMGISHQGTRDVYESFGYKKTLDFNDFLVRYKRQDIAKAVIKRPASSTWAGTLEVIETHDDKKTPFEEGWDELSQRLKLKSKFARLDRLTSLGKYGVLLLGFNDVSNREGFRTPVSKTKKNLQINYVKPVSEGNALIGSYEDNPSSSRFGLPKTYNINLKGTASGGTMATINVHYTRVIHVAWDLMEDEVEGVPVMESIFNRLYDLEKLVGGSAEMFWRGARPGFQGILEDDYSLGPDADKDLQDKFAEYENGLRRAFMMEGVKLQSLAPQVQDPTNHVKVQVQMISAVTGIPQRVLLGAEQGELASGQDADAWKTLIQDRRTEQVEPTIIRPFIDRCVEYGVLPKPSTEFYSIMWSDLFAPSEKERAETGKTRAAAIQQYLQNPMATEVIPPRVFTKYLLGLSKEQLEYVEEVRQSETLSEEEFARRARELDNPNEEQQND